MIDPAEKAIFDIKSKAHGAVELASDKLDAENTCGTGRSIGENG